MDAETLKKELHDLKLTQEGFDDILVLTQSALSELTTCSEEFDDDSEEAIISYYKSVSSESDPIPELSARNSCARVNLESAFEQNIQLPLLLSWLPTDEAHRVYGLATGNDGVQRPLAEFLLGPDRAEEMDIKSFLKGFEPGEGEPSKSERADKKKKSKLKPLKEEAATMDFYFPIAPGGGVPPISLKHKKSAPAAVAAAASCQPPPPPLPRSRSNSTASHQPSIISSGSKKDDESKSGGFFKKMKLNMKNRSESPSVPGSSSRSKDRNKKGLRLDENRAETPLTTSKQIQLEEELKLGDHADFAVAPIPWGKLKRSPSQETVRATPSTTTRSSQVPPTPSTMSSQCPPALSTTVSQTLVASPGSVTSFPSLPPPPEREPPIPEIPPPPEREPPVPPIPATNHQPSTAPSASTLQLDTTNLNRSTTSLAQRTPSLPASTSPTSTTHSSPKRRRQSSSKSSKKSRFPLFSRQTTKSDEGKSTRRSSTATHKSGGSTPKTPKTPKKEEDDYYANFMLPGGGAGTAAFSTRTKRRSIHERVQIQEAEPVEEGPKVEKSAALLDEQRKFFQRAFPDDKPEKAVQEYGQHAEIDLPVFVYGFLAYPDVLAGILGVPFPKWFARHMHPATLYNWVELGVAKTEWTAAVQTKFNRRRQSVEQSVGVRMKMRETKLDADGNVDVYAWLDGGRPIVADEEEAVDDPLFIRGFLVFGLNDEMRARLDWFHSFSKTFVSTDVTATCTVRWPKPCKPSHVPIPDACLMPSDNRRDSTSSRHGNSSSRQNLTRLRSARNVFTQRTRSPLPPFAPPRLSTDSQETVRGIITSAKPPKLDFEDFEAVVTERAEAIKESLAAKFRGSETSASVEVRCRVFGWVAGLDGLKVAGLEG